MTCIRPAGRRGACSCGNQYAQILDRLDTVEQEASDAKTTAQTAANSASIQAANAATDAAQAASDAADALLQAGNAANSAAAAAQDAADAAADLASINSTISSTLTTYLGTKVDKLSTTGSFAYTHTNATQGETALVDGTTSNTIPIRDANGRMQAADPASGATDKTLVTANWVSQTGDSGPNNLVHRSGNERKTGVLYTSTPYLFKGGVVPSSSASTRTNYHRVLSFTRSNVNNTKFELTIIGGLNNTRTGFAKALLSFGSNAGDVVITPLIAIASSVNWSVNIKVIRTANTVDIWVREAQFTNFATYCTIRYGQYVEIISSVTGLSIGDMATSSDPSSEADTVATINVTPYNEYPMEV